MTEEKKLVKSWQTPLGKVVYCLTGLWLIVFFGGAKYFICTPKPILVGSWLPAVLIWFHVLFFWGLIMSYLYFYKLGAGKGL
jgi:hypothetical protein